MSPALCAYVGSPTSTYLRAKSVAHSLVMAGINIPELRPRREYPQFQPLFQPSLIPCLYSATSEKIFAHVVNYFYEASFCALLLLYLFQMC